MIEKTFSYQQHLCTHTLARRHTATVFKKKTADDAEAPSQRAAARSG